MYIDILLTFLFILILSRALIVYCATFIIDKNNAPRCKWRGGDKTKGH